MTLTLPILVLLACRGGPEPAGLRDAAGDLLRVGYVDGVTGGASETDTLPLIVVVHGLGDVPESMLRVLGDYPEPARIVAPRGIDPHHNGWSWFPIGRVGDDAGPEVAAPVMQQRAATLVEFIGAYRERHPTAGEPVITGFSQGGMLSFAIAVEHPAAVGRAVPVAGWLPPELWPEEAAPPGAPPIHALHGEADTLLPLGPTREAVEHLRSKGWTVELQTFPGVQHGVPDEVRAAWYQALAAE